MNALQGSPLFPITSRYYAVDSTTIVSGGREIAYLQRRFIPSADQFSTLQLYTVTDGDRLDNVTAATLGDPLAFWRLCDANNVMRPESLTATVGSVIRITLPQGIPGMAGA